MLLLKILLIAIIIIASVIALLSVLFSFKTKLTFTFKNEFSISLKYLFFNIKLFPFKEKKPKKKRKQKENNTAPDEGSSQTQDKPKAEKADKTHDENIKDKKNIKKTKNKIGFIEKTLENLTFWNYIEILEIIFNKFINKIYCDEINLDIIIASEDAAQTALNYGNANAAIYPLAGLLYNSGRAKSIHINITPDFTKKNSSFKGNVIISTRLIYAIISMIYIIKNLLN